MCGTCSRWHTGPTQNRPDSSARRVRRVSPAAAAGATGGRPGTGYGVEASGPDPATGYGAANVEGVYGGNGAAAGSGAAGWVTGTRWRISAAFVDARAMNAVGMVISTGTARPEMSQ